MYFYETLLHRTHIITIIIMYLTYYQNYTNINNFFARSDGESGYDHVILDKNSNIIKFL